MKRIISLDIIKIIAILSVIIAHTMLICKSDSNNLFTIGHTINSIFSCIGVPLFMCTSGALILKKDLNATASITNFYKHNLLTIIITGEIWIIFYFLCNQHFSFRELLYNIALIHKPEIHLWYIRMIILYYIAMPIISYLVTKAKILMIFITSIIICATFIYNGFLIYKGYPYPTTSGLSYTCYLIYLLAGYYISKQRFSSINHCIFLSIIILSFIGLFLSHWKNHYMIWYDNPFILLISVSLFELIYRITKKINLTSHDNRLIKIISDLSNMTFGIYLSHMLFIIVLRHYCNEIINSRNINIIIYPLTIIIIVCTIAIIKITKKINKDLSYISIVR